MRQTRTNSLLRLLFGIALFLLAALAAYTAIEDRRDGLTISLYSALTGGLAIYLADRSALRWWQALAIIAAAFGLATVTA